VVLAAAAGRKPRGIKGLELAPVSTVEEAVALVFEPRPPARRTREATP
jgi:hypothetical protein